MSTPTRYGQWVTTLPFALNHDYYADAVQTPFFTTPYTDTIPVLTEWLTTGINPSGWRHRTDHPAFIRVLASGRGAASLDFGSFDLQTTDIGRGSGVSKTKVMSFRIARYTSPGVTRVHGMRVWAADTSDFLEPQTHKILWTTSQVWTSGFVFEPADMGNQEYWMPTSLPIHQNLFKCDGMRTIVGSGDADVSEWMYIALAASGTMPLGEYGDTTDGPEGFNIRVTYNVDNFGEVVRFQV